MRSRFRLLLLLLLLFVVWVGLPQIVNAAESRDIARLRLNNALLKAEYELARKGNPYLVVDLPGSRLQLKAGGLTLSNWVIAGARRWGRLPEPAASHLVDRHSSDAPERDVQVVTLEQGDAVLPPRTLGALELEDMPTSYRLKLESGTLITVNSIPASRFGRLLSAARAPFWYASRPLISDWNFFKGSPYNEIALVLSTEDARMLYWAFREGVACLIRPPDAGPAS